MNSNRVRPNQLSKTALTLYQTLFSKFPKGVQMFNRRGMDDDPKQTLYNDGTVVADYCPTWNYLEVIGLSYEDYRALEACINARR